MTWSDWTNAVPGVCFAALLVLLYFCPRTRSRKEWYRSYLRSSHWRAVRLQAVQRAGHRCEECGVRGRLEVHHLTYERLGRERDTDIAALCPACHRKEHGL